MRVLDQKKITYKTHTYDAADGAVDGISAAGKIGVEPDRVFKTLVTRSSGGEYAVFVIPVAEELDLKKAAAAAGHKKIEMIPVKDLLPTTGYIRGGCSPLGMKKLFPTFIDESAELFDTIVFSGGQIGIQLEMAVQYLLPLCEGTLADITAIP